MPRSVGQALAAAMMQGRNTATLAGESQRRNKLTDLEMLQAQMRMQQLAKQAKAEQASAENQAALQQHLRSLTMPRYPQGATVMSDQGRARMEGGPQQRPIDPLVLMSEYGVPPDVAQKLAGARDWGRPEVARTVDTEGPGGSKNVRQLDKFGRPIGSDLPGFMPPVQVNQGDRVTFAKPLAGTSLPVGMSASERDSSARGWSNLALERERMAREGAGPKPPAGYQWKPDGSLVVIPGGPADIKTQTLDATAAKQVTGVKNLQRAVKEYTDVLDNWGATDALRPDQRAKMGTVYNNMMLQAKEAYNLGVLNGPDFQILQSVVTDPRSIVGTVTSNEALGKQATELARIMSGVEAGVREGHAKGGGGSDWTPEPDRTGGGKIIYFDAQGNRVAK